MRATIPFVVVTPIFSGDVLTIAVRDPRDVRGGGQELEMPTVPPSSGGTAAGSVRVIKRVGEPTRAVVVAPFCITRVQVEMPPPTGGRKRHHDVSLSPAHPIDGDRVRGHGRHGSGVRGRGDDPVGAVAGEADERPSGYGGGTITPS